MSVYDLTLDHDLYPGDLIAMEFLTAVIAEEGTRTYGDDAAVGDFTERTDATTATMLAEAKAFWQDGVRNAGEADATVGFSSTTPREYFDCFISDGTGTGTWQYATGTSLTGMNWALGLRGWYATYGYDTKAADIYTWLMGASSNASYETGASTLARVWYAAETGTYNPKRALSTYILATQKNGSALYDWATFGLLSGIHSARDYSSFTDAKREVSTSKRYAYDGVASAKHFRLNLRGKGGLSGQVQYTETILGAARRVYDAVAAAMIGLAYRVSPKIHVVKDHPPR